LCIKLVKKTIMVDVSLSLTAVCAVDVHPRVVISVLPADDFSAFFPLQDIFWHSKTDI